MFICSVLSVRSLYKTCISITLLPHTHIYVHKHTHTHFFLSQTLSIYFPVVLFLHTISWETHLHTPKHSHTDSVFPLSMPVTLLSTQLTCVATDTHEYTYRQCFSFNMPATLPSTQLSCVVTHIHTHTDSVFHSIRLRRFGRHDWRASWHGSDLHALDGLGGFGGDVEHLFAQL